MILSVDVVLQSAFADQVVSSISQPGVPKGFGVNPQTNMIYISSSLGMNPSDRVFIANGSTNSVMGNVTVGKGPGDIAVNPKTGLVYVADYGYNSAPTLSSNGVYQFFPGDSVWVINSTTNAVAKTITVGSAPEGISVNPETDKIYVANSESGTVSVIDGLTSNVITTIQVGKDPTSISVNPSTNMIYVAVSGSNNVVVINGITDTIASTISGFSSPIGIDANPVTNKIYVTNPGNGTLFVIDGNTNSILHSLFVGNGDEKVKTDSSSGKVYVTVDGSQGDGVTISIINGTTDTYMQALSVPTQPGNIAINPATNRIYVDSNAYYTISVIDGTTSTTSPTPTAPSPPQNLQVKAYNGPDNYFVLSWSYPANDGGSPVTNYEIYYSTTKGAEKLEAYANNALSYTIYGGSNGQTFYFEVKALTSFGQSGFSNEANATIPSSPTVPLNLRAVGGNLQVHLSWSSPSSNGGSSITNYKIYKSTISGSEVQFETVGNVTTYNDTSVTNGQTYFYKVTSVNSVGESPQSNEANATPTASGVTVKSIDQNNNPIYGFLTLLCSQGTSTLANGSNTCETGDSRISSGNTTVTFDEPPGYTLGVEVYNNATCSFNHWSDNAQDTYRFRLFNTASPPTILTAVYSCGNVSTAPQPPTSLSATAASSSQINLSWTSPSSDGGSTITGYMIERSTNNGTSWSTLQANTATTSTTYSDTGLAHSTTYTYRVSAINSVGTSMPSNTASATTLNTVPTPPTGLTATPNVTQINLSWSEPSDNGGTPVTGYMIERSTNSGTTWTILVTNTGSVSTSYSDANVLPLTTYTYRVSAINNVGTSGPSNTASASTTLPESSSPPPIASITLNNVQSTSGTTSSSNQIILSSFNAGSGSNQLLAVGISANNQNAISVTFNGVQLTKAVSSFNNNDAEFWYLKNPSGAGNVVATFAGQTQAVVGAYSFANVNQTSPIANTATNSNTASSSPTISITAKYANDWVLDLPSIYGGQKLGSPTCTQEWNTNIPSAITGASSSAIVSLPSSVTCSWTASNGGDLWDDVAVEVKSSG